MSNNWDTISIPFQGGIDTKSDHKSVSPTKLVSLENGVFTKRGSIRKRHGYDRTEPLDSDGAAATGEALASKDGALLMLGPGDAYSYDVADDSWVNQGYFNRVGTTSRQVEASTLEKTLGDRAESNGITVRAWISSGGGMEVSISSTATGAILKKLSGGTVGGGNRPRCVRVGLFLHVVFAVGASTDLYTLPINTFDPTAVVDGDAVVIASDLHADEIFDVCESGDQSAAFFAWYSTDANESRRGRLLPSGGTENKTGSNSGPIVDLSIAAYGDTLLIGQIVALKASVLIVSDANATMSPVSGDDLNTAGYVKGVIAANDTDFCYLLEPTYTDPENATVDALFGPYDDFGAVTYTTEAARHSALASGCFTVDGKMFAFLKHESAKSLQGCYFLMQLHTGDDAMRMVGQLEVASATPLDSEPHLPHFSLRDDGTIAGLLPTRATVASTNSDTFKHLGFSEVVVTPNSSAYEAAQAGTALHVPGGIIWHLDGKDPVEQGFTLYPELDVGFGETDPAQHAAVDVTTAGTLAAGTRSYKVFYEWTNAQGEIMRSTAFGFSVNAPGSFKVELTIPTLHHTHKGLSNAFGARDDVSIAVFRTAIGGSLYFRISGTDPATTTGDNPYVFNDRDANSVTFLDDMADAVAILREKDASVGLVDNGPPPSCNLLIQAQRRMFAAGGSIPSNRVAYTKLRIDGEPIEFNEGLTIELPDRGGDFTGLASMNGNLVTFKRTSIMVVAGDGPDNTGAGDFQEPWQVPTDVGCVDGRVIVETPKGIIFRSEKGFHMLNRQFGVEYVGAPVEGFNAANFVSAKLMADQNAAIFLSDSGESLVYDYEHDQWGSLTNHQGKSAVIWQGKYCYLRADSAVFRQNPAKFTDGNQAYRLKLKTGPIRVEGLQDYWKLKRFSVLAEYFSEHTLRMNLWFNREGAPSETVVFDPLDFIDDSRWGDEATWGAKDKWGGELDGRDYQIQYDPETMKCQSVSVEIEEIPGTEPGRSFELAELAMLWAPMKGLGRIAGSRRK